MELLNNAIIRFIVHRILNIYLYIFAAWNLIPFVFLSFNKWWPLYKELNYIGFIFYIPLVFLAGPILKFIFPPTKHLENNKIK